VLQATQAWRDDQAELEACLRSGEFEELLQHGQQPIDSPRR
jgi:hypothetical protein